MIGTYVLSAGYYDAYFVKALKVRRLICNDFTEAYKKVDLILTPTTPTAAFAIGEEPKDPIAMYMNDVLTVTLLGYLVCQFQLVFQARACLWECN